MVRAESAACFISFSLRCLPSTLLPLFFSLLQVEVLRDASNHYPAHFLVPLQLLKCRRLCDFHCFFPAHCWITSPPPSFPPFSVVLSVASPSSSHKSFVFLFWRTVIGQKTIGECEYPSAMTIMPFSSGMESKRKLERMGLLCEGGSLWSGGSE